MSAQPHFGFEAIDAQARQHKVNALFARVAPRYDLMNDVMSLGMHRWWKRRMVDVLAPTASARVLDLATGTGDIAALIKARQPLAPLTLCDINPAMLHQSKQRLVNTNAQHGVRWVCGNAETLPFPAHSFDRCSMAFGIRNVTDIERALENIYRVLSPGGTFVCLEFSTLVVPILTPLYDAYSLSVIPALGGMIADDKEAYRYLVESIRRFPSQETFASMLRAAGFARVAFRNMSGGVVALHTGVKC